MAMTSFSKIMHKAGMFQEWFEVHNNKFEVLPNSPDLSLVNCWWDVLVKRVPIRGGLTSQLTVANIFRQHTVRGLVESAPRWVRVVSAPNGDQQNIRQTVMLDV